VTREDSYDVAVIGAGPMGSFAAERMARAGLRVILFEKDAVPGASGVCAGAINAEVARFIGLPAEAVERTLHSLQVRTPKRTRAWTFPQPAYVTVDRRRLDRLLADRAVAAGAELRTGSRVIRVNPEHQSLACDPDEEEVHARVFVFADGPNSLARERRGGLRYAAVQYELDAPANDLPALEFFVDARRIPFGYAWAFPKRDAVTVGLGRLTAVRGLSLWNLLDQFVRETPELRGRRILRRQGGTIPAGAAPVLQRDNWLAIGDAAGMVNPLTGGGYVCGFKSAVLAAETCIEAFRNGSFDERALAAYPRRLRATKQYAVVRLGHLALRAMLATHRATGRSLYPLALDAYLRLVHAAMRLGARAF